MRFISLRTKHLASTGFFLALLGLCMMTSCMSSFHKRKYTPGIYRAPRAGKAKCDPNLESAHLSTRQAETQAEPAVEWDSPSSYNTPDKTQTQKCSTIEQPGEQSHNRPQDDLPDDLAPIAQMEIDENEVSIEDENDTDLPPEEQAELLRSNSKKINVLHSIGVAVALGAVFLLLLSTIAGIVMMSLGAALATWTFIWGFINLKKMQDHSPDFCTRSELFNHRNTFWLVSLGGLCILIITAPLVIAGLITMGSLKNKCWKRKALEPKLKEELAQ